MPEPEPLQRPAEERRGEVGEEHPGALVDVAGEELGIEMVAMQVRHVEEVGPAEVLRYQFGRFAEKETKTRNMQA